MNERRDKPSKPYVGDYGAPIEGTGRVAAASLSMVVLACLVGFVVGVVVWGALSLSNLLIRLLWHDLPAALPFDAPWLPLVLCPLGGLIIGMWTRAFRNAPASLEAVMGEVRATGGYRLRGLGSSIVSFLLPLAFGGSIGPEAGLTGIIAAACTWIGNTLKRAGLKVKAVTDLTLSATLSAVFGAPLLGIVMNAEEQPGAPSPDDYSFRRPAKLLLYTAAAFGAFGGAAFIGGLLGDGAGLPRFSSIEVQGIAWLWTVPLALAGWALGLLFHASNRAFGSMAGRFRKDSLLPPLIAGVALGAVAVALPGVLFSGERQCHTIMEEWTAVSALALLAAGALKVVATPLCLNFGWRGGNFFPCIFAGVSFGYGIAALSGIDPMLCVTVVTTALVACMTRKPLLTLALLILCFPIDGILASGVAALVGSALPVPRSLVDAPRADGGGAADDGEGKAVETAVDPDAAGANAVASTAMDEER